MKRLPVLVMFSLLSGIVFAGDVRSPGDAWSYLTKPGTTRQWVVISAKNGKGYMQCENVETQVRCPFPIWAKVNASTNVSRPVEPRPVPYPDVPNSKKQEYLSVEQETALKAALKQLNLEPSDVYAKQVDKKGRIVGTAHDVVVVLDLNYKSFDNLISSFFSAVWKGAPNSGYAYDVGRWE